MGIRDSVKVVKVVGQVRHTKLKPFVRSERHLTQLRTIGESGTTHILLVPVLQTSVNDTPVFGLGFHHPKERGSQGAATRTMWDVSFQVRDPKACIL